MEEDVLEMIFEKRGDDDSFKIQDEKLKQLKRKVGITNKIMFYFISRKVDSNCRMELKKLIDKRNKCMSDYHYRENQLFYKNGVADGMNIILSIINLK